MSTDTTTEEALSLITAGAALLAALCLVIAPALPLILP
jgi:hypothetical protein